ncbi:MAG TPA: extracellular solute-binding protein [Thermotogota bacterium]|nr:extracellular solute-binding protein [Thermotogota bacterium]
MKRLAGWVLLLLLWGTSGFPGDLTVSDITTRLVGDRYDHVLQQWKDDGWGSPGQPGESFFVEVPGNWPMDLLPGESLEWNVEVDRPGLYAIELDYTVLATHTMDIEIAVRCNGAFPFFEGRRIVLQRWWQTTESLSREELFVRDRFGNETIPGQQPVGMRQRVLLRDAAFTQPQALWFLLREGNNTLSLQLGAGSGVLLPTLRLHGVRLCVPADIPSYECYRRAHPGVEPGSGEVQVLEAEMPWRKNDTTINPVVSRDAEVFPQDVRCQLLNTLGGDTWKKSGQTVVYRVCVPTPGWYQLALKFSQDLKPNAVVYRSLAINGQVPFAEVEHLAFFPESRWKVHTLGTAEDEGYLFFLHQGTNTISLESDSRVYGEQIDRVNALILQLNDLALQVRKLVGTNIDRNIDWEIRNYFPGIDAQLAEIIGELNRLYEQLLQKNTSESNPAANRGARKAQALISLQNALDIVQLLAQDPDSIPRRFPLLSEGTNSVVRELSRVLEEMENQPLLLDRLYVFPPGETLPDEGVSVWQRFWMSTRRFLHSFSTPPELPSSGEDTLVLHVWVNRSRNHVDLLQKLTDRQFTPQTGIQVDFSIMPDEQKLVLAYAGKTSPDLALGISNWLPFELGIRGAVVNLERFADFPEVVRRFSPGALLPFLFEGSCYGLPETQDFYVLFFRSDILSALGIPVPGTWDEVKQILPELQRYGMNFYLPIAGASGSKPFMATAPFLYQAQGDFYTSDGFETALNTPRSLEGVRLMTELFTVYGLPLQVPNFFEHFRDGTLPIGVSNFTTYVQLSVTAPELRNSWDIALSPGVENPDGEVQRWQTGSAQSVMMFADTSRQQAAWEFLKWWLSAQVQATYAQQIQAMYGKEFMWSSANLQGFANSPFPVEHRQVVLEQWEWLKEVPKTPAGYMVERELSNAWTRVVFQGQNLRTSVDDSVILINREIVRKLQEFGYLSGTRRLKPYHVPTIGDVLDWGRKDGNP